MKKLYLETKRIINDAMANGQLVLFVGAGASVESGMPLWKAAIDNIAKKMPLTEEQKKTLDTFKIPQYYFNSRGKKEYTQLMRDIFRYEDNLRPTKLHKKLLDFQTATIVTTNYDHLIELAAEDNGEFIRVISQDIDMPYRKSRRELIKMHGDFEHDNFVLKEDDYLNYSRNFRLIETYIKSLIGSKVVLFIGYSLNDPDVKHIFSWVKDVLKEDFQRAYLILTKTEPNSIEKEYFKNLGVNLIYGSELIETEEVTHGQQLIEVIDYLQTKEQENDLDELFNALKPFEDLNYVYGKYVVNAFRKYDIVCRDDNEIDFFRIDNNSNSRPLMEMFWNTFEKKKGKTDFDKEKVNSILRVCEKSRFSVFRKKEGNRCVSHPINNLEISPIEGMIFKFDYKGLRNLLEDNYSKLSSDAPDLYMQQAYICAFLDEFYNAYNYLKVASKEFYVRKSYAWYFIAELNRKYVGEMVTTVFWPHELGREEQKIFESEVKAIDLDRVLNSIPDIENDANVFLHELKNFTISYNLFYNVYADSLKTSEQASTTYSLFAGTAAYESLRLKIRDFDRYETSNYIILDKYTENKSIFDLYIRTILSSINSTDIMVKYASGVCGNIKADSLTDFDLYIILRYMQQKDLKKYFKEYGIKKIPLCEEGKVYLDEVCQPICEESIRPKHTIWGVDRFWGYLELINHTNISEKVAQKVLQRLLQINNEVDIRTHRDLIRLFIRNIGDEKFYKNNNIYNLSNNFTNKVMEFVIAEKEDSGAISSVIIELLYFMNMSSIQFGNIDLIKKFIEGDYRALLFDAYPYLNNDSQIIIKENYHLWKPKERNVLEYFQYCEGVLAAVLDINQETEGEILLWISNMIDTVIKDDAPIMINYSISYIDVMHKMITLFLNDKILDIDSLKKIVEKSDDEMSKWLLDLDEFDYRKFQCSWLTLCSQSLIETIVKNETVKKNILKIYKEQYSVLNDRAQINEIIIKNFI